MNMFVMIFLSIISLICVSSLEACPKCGNMDVPYPLSTDESCGNPKYRVYCNNGNLEFLSATGFYYKILSTNPSAYKLIISPPSIQENTCQSSDLTLGGLSLDEESPFNISTRNTVMLLNCSKNILLSPLNCSSNSLCRLFEDKVVMGRGCKNTLCCTYLKDASMTSHRIRIRVGGCSAYTSIVDIKSESPESWNYGVELQWLPPN
ncbi:wall-associated receptor kinase-like 20 [Cornus florida]|uniref:wall-associated receptor kinase-like 20 n=1 Tax=Cornus florida TaxID=4283 RepID=UPI0028A24F7E|nr:wall-associated receptor kinase-like 20 [Cornus florida]